MAVPLAGGLLTWTRSLPPRHPDSAFIGRLFLPNGFWFALAMLHFQGVGWDRNHTPFLTFGVAVSLLFAWHTTRVIVVYL
jgi:hypothetical protein